MIPMNFATNGKVDIIHTGVWTKKVIKDTKLYADVNIVASSEEDGFRHIPDVKGLKFRPDADYVYICDNNTIYGSKYKEYPDTGNIPLVCDMSSCFLSEPIDVKKFGMIYAGAQKNVGPAGMVIVIVREDLIREDVLPGTPTMLKYKTHSDAGSLYNTPNCWCIYMCGLVFKHLLANGGLSEMKKRNEEKAKILYDYLDNSKLFLGTVEKSSRSLMNVPFIVNPNVITDPVKKEELEAKFVSEAKKVGLENLKGHRSVGGMRASIYNAMPKEGVIALVNFMKKFEEENL
jgi:phosphoserine aminotransferase